MNQKMIIGAIVVIILIGGGILLVKNRQSTTTTSSPTPSSTPQSTTGTAVSISGFAFSEKTVTVHVGDTVTWTNNDSVAHTVTSTDGGPLNSSTIAPGATFKFTFTTAGTFAYHCTIHPDMTGSVTVQ